MQASQAVLEQLIVMSRQATGGRVPEHRQRSGGALRGQGADLLLEPQSVLPHPVAVGAFGKLVESAIEQSGEGLRRCLLRTVRDQHEREVVPKLGEIAVAGEKRGTQAKLADRIELASRALPGQMKYDVRLKFCLHVGVALLCRPNPPDRGCRLRRPGLAFPPPEAKP